MKITIDKETGTPVYIQVFEQIRRQILSGELMPGFRLPPERKLAESLGINRSTVLNAYRELKAEGFIGSRVGDGTVVLSYLQEESTPESLNLPEPSWNLIFNRNASEMGTSIVRDLLTLANRKDVISFATGMASPETSPLQALEGMEHQLVGLRNYRALLHTPTEGFTSLREAICGLMQKRGVYCQTDEVMVVSGSQQGIDLAARIILDPGDIVVVEDPSYFPAIQAFKTREARVMGVPVDEKGMRIDVLEQLLQRYRPKLIYTIPTFHNPTGVEMELERRKRLLELAYKYRVIILEDDAYGDLCFEGCMLPTLKSMDNSGYVIYLSTFSKNIYAGLRLGWIAAHKKVVKRFAAAKQIMDLHSSSLSQWIIERFITSGGLYEHVPKVCREYRAKRDAMYDALSRHAPADLIWNRPRGGYYIWCRLPHKVSAARLVLKAARHKVAFVPGTPFFTDGRGNDHIRLNFTFVAQKDITVGVKRLCEAINEVIADNDEPEDNINIEINPIV